MFELYIQGFLLSISLIAAIGSQNSYVLKQGLLKQHIVTIIFICFFCDSFLMCFGILGFSSFILEYPLALETITLAGILFLLYYGFLSFKRVFISNKVFDISCDQKNSYTKVILTTLALTLLNPHVYLDTIVILGSIGNKLSHNDKIVFLTGALTASLVWFCSLGLGSAYLSKYLSSIKVWKCIDTIIGFTMFYLAFNLYSNFSPNALLNLY